MKIKIRKAPHSEEVHEFEFKTLNELLEIPLIQEWQKKMNFFRFSRNHSQLIAEFRKGREWWIVGYFIKEPKKLDLPIWEMKK